MKRKLTGMFRLTLITACVCIVLPILVLAVWSVAKSWRFPALLPDALTIRGFAEIFSTTSGTFSVLLSSVGISTCVALLATVVGTLTARAIVIHAFRFKNAVLFLNLLPLMIPAAAFAMGVHIAFIRLGLSDTVVGVVIIHLICVLPYSVNIMTDVTALSGKDLEEQALLLGATPFRAFREVSFHALLPGLIASFCMAYVLSFGQYFITLIIGGGNVKTLSTLMIPYIQSGDRTLSGAYSMVFIASTLIMFVIVEKIGKKIALGKLTLLK